MFYKVPGTALIHEFLEDEIILANLDTGVYYSIRGSGVPLWQLLIEGCSLKQITNLFQETYQTDLTAPIHAFVNLLLDEQVLIETSGKENTPSLSHLCWPHAFTPPTIEKHEEMKELLVIDPIHEVDEKGWPHKAPDQAQIH